ncbi:MAG: hypothetical protein ACE5PO_07250 [Candidatus Bathyarchaeia archaeon]
MARAKLEEDLRKEFARKIALAEGLRQKVDDLGKQLDDIIRDLKALAK